MAFEDQATVYFKVAMCILMYLIFLQVNEAKKLHTFFPLFLKKRGFLLSLKNFHICENISSSNNANSAKLQEVLICYQAF